MKLSSKRKTSAGIRSFQVLKMFLASCLFAQLSGEAQAQTLMVISRVVVGVQLTNQFDNNGNFNFTNAIGTNWQNFYMLQVQ